MFKKKFFYKSYNINKKLNGCFNCHKINKIKNKFPVINKLNIKYIYNKLNEFKFFKIYNFNMNNLIIKLKNKYIIEISKYLKEIPKIFNLIFLNIK